MALQKITDIKKEKGRGCLGERYFALYLTQMDMDYSRLPGEMKSLWEVTWEEKQNYQCGLSFGPRLTRSCKSCTVVPSPVLKVKSTEESHSGDQPQFWGRLGSLSHIIALAPCFHSGECLWKQTTHTHFTCHMCPLNFAFTNKMWAFRRQNNSLFSFQGLHNGTQSQDENSSKQLLAD